MSIRSEVHALLFGADREIIEKFRLIWEKRISMLSQDSVRNRLRIASSETMEELAAEWNRLRQHGVNDAETACGLLLSGILLGMQMESRLEQNR